MKLLASCSLEESSKFDGKLVIPCEDKKSPDKVLLNIVVEDGNNGVFSKLTGKEECVTFVGGGAEFCPTEWRGKVFNQYSLEDLQAGFSESKVEGVTDIVRLPENYSNMRELLGFQKSYPCVRFIGGHLLALEGLNIGRYATGREKLPLVLKDIYDSFVEVCLSDLDGIQEVVRKTRAKMDAIESGVEGKPKRKSGSKKSSDGSSGSGSGEKKATKKIQVFNGLFGSQEVEF